VKLKFKFIENDDTFTLSPEKFQLDWVNSDSFGGVSGYSRDFLNGKNNFQNKAFS